MSAARSLPVVPARAGCPDVRPCDRTACRMNMGTRGTESCALDVAERGGVTREEIAAVMGETSERVRTLEERGMRRLAAAWRAMGGPELEELTDDRWSPSLAAPKGARRWE